jgi:hypothetical protein
MRQVVEQRSFRVLYHPVGKVSSAPAVAMNIDKAGDDEQVFRIVRTRACTGLIRRKLVL